jgi:hypothetical protein
MVSFRVVSEIAMVPESECSTPTLIGQVTSCAEAAPAAMRARAATPENFSDLIMDVTSLVRGVILPSPPRRPVGR